MSFGGLVRSTSQKVKVGATGVTVITEHFGVGNVEIYRLAAPTVKVVLEIHIC